MTRKPDPAADLDPLQVLIGFSRGSASDHLIQLIASDLPHFVGRPLHVDWIPGELGAKAARATVTSPPNGNTLLVATFGSHVVNPNLNPNLGYDPIADFTPICLATRSPLILATRPSLGADSVAEFIRMSARRELTFGSSGIGSAPYLAATLLQKMAAIRMCHRAYNDTRVLYEDLESERLDLSINNVSYMLPRIREGRLRALAVTTSKRSTALPGVPTFAEAGLQDYALCNWLGFVAPPMTSPEIAALQAQAIGAALRIASIKAELTNHGTEVVSSSPSQFEAFLKAELKRWSWLRSG